MVSNMRLSDAYLKMNQLDSALYFAKEADFFSKNPAYRGSYRGLNISYIGETYFKKGETKLAKKYYFEGLILSTEKNLKASIAEINHKLIKLFLQENEKKSALIYALKNLEIVKSIGNESMETGTEYEDVYLAYQLNNQLDSAYKYQGLALVAKDSFYKTRIKNIADFQSLSLEETMRLENLEKDKIQTQAKTRTYALLSVLAVLSIIGFILYRNNRQKQKANAVLQEKNEEIQSTLSKLKSTQAQLIQSEKLASLGELTAGIAHEIQNPLNFVNNFSELSVDLAKELKEEIDKSPLTPDGGIILTDKGYIDEILGDLSQNQEKINHHGKRASSIVKGMLEHSRASTGVKELTDINDLADEYLRLAYHGLRAKDSSFNATLETHFDENLPKIEVIPQDIGRVLLNLLNNAFYAVNSPQTPDEGFKNH
jgi:two-component system, NtrC family, sensor kinase